MEFPTIQVICILFLSFATLICYAMGRYHRLWNRANSVTLPPSPPSFPIIGHLPLLSDMPHHTFAQLAQKLGPIIYLQLGQVPTLIISSAQFAEAILKTLDHVFANRPRLVAAQYLTFGCSGVTFSSNGPYWRQVRKICITELLSPKRVNSFQIIRNKELNRVFDTLSTRANSEVNISEVFFTLANDVLCMVAFGKRFPGQDVNSKGENKKDLLSILTETQELLAGFCMGDFFPEWRWVNSLSGMKKRLMKNLEDLKNVSDEIINEHVKKGKKRDDEKDFVDVLLEVQQRIDLEVPITDDNVKALVMDMFVAGTDTTSATLEWTMTELARHPTIMKKAQDEVRQIAATKGDLEESDLQHLTYLKAVIKETMRLHPPVPLLFPRESMEKCTLHGYEIPAKTRVLINTYAIGRDQESWENPLEYKPERFLEQDINFRGQDFRFLPFGGGRRGCPGFSFGLASVEITLARLLKHFDWKLPKGLNVSDVDLEETFGLATRKKSPLRLVPTIPKQLEPSI